MAAWMLTFTGRRVNPLDLCPDDVCIADIAHQLALVNRFAGGTRRPISVAQHSVYVARLCAGQPCEKAALLHDASEAYLGDMVKWVKEHASMTAYRSAEARAKAVIYATFGLAPDADEAPAIQAADRLMARLEGERGFGRLWTNGHLDPARYPPVSPEQHAAIGRWAPWSWQAAERGFLDHWRLLC